MVSCSGDMTQTTREYEILIEYVHFYALQLSEHEQCDVQRCLHAAQRRGRRYRAANDDLDENCAICLERLGRHYLTTTCGHRYHYPCIMQSMMHTRRCPICRAHPCVDVNLLMGQSVELLFLWYRYTNAVKMGFVHMMRSLQHHVSCAEEPEIVTCSLFFSGRVRRRGLNHAAKKKYAFVLRRIARICAYHTKHLRAMTREIVDCLSLPCEAEMLQYIAQMNFVQGFLGPNGEGARLLHKLGGQEATLLDC